MPTCPVPPTANKNHPNLTAPHCRAQETTDKDRQHIARSFPRVSELHLQRAVNGTAPRQRRWNDYGVRRSGVQHQASWRITPSGIAHLARCAQLRSLTVLGRTLSNAVHT